MTYYSKNHLVFIHGNSSSDKVFENQNAHFENKTILTLPGHGNSAASKEPEKDYSIASLSSKIEESCSGSENCILIGNSLGGHIAIEAAPAIPNLKALVLFGTPPLKKPLNIEEAYKPVEALASYFQGEYEEDVLRQNLSVAVHDPIHTELLVQDFMRTDPMFREVWTKDVTVNMSLADEAEILAGLTIPVYVIYGEEDPSVNIEYVKNLEGVRKFYAIENCGHYPSLEQPEKFNAILETILREIEELEDL